MKEVIVLLLSGASIPLAFFPEKLAAVVQKLPFQAIYNIPLTILIGKSFSMGDYFKMLGIQGFWVIITGIVAVVFFHFSLKKITVNGG